MTGMMLLEHVLACGWFGVGYHDTAAGISWLAENNLKEVSQLVQAAFVQLNLHKKNLSSFLFRNVARSRAGFTQESFYKQYTASSCLRSSHYAETKT